MRGRARYPAPGRVRPPAAAAALALGAWLHAEAVAGACAPIRFAPCVPAEPPPPAAAESACSARCDKLAEQVSRGCGGGAEAAYADTVYLRRAIELEMTQDDRVRLALVAAAVEPDTAAHLAQPLLGRDEPDIVHAAATHVALAAARADDFDATAFRTGLALMERSAAAAGVPDSDRLFFLALAAAAAGETAEALTQARAALAIEPRFFNAAAFALQLQVGLLARQGRRAPGDCQRDHGVLLDLLAAIAALEPCQRVAAHLEILVSRRLLAPDRSPTFAVAQVYLALIARRPELAGRALERFRHLEGPICADAVAGELEALIATYRRVVPAIRP